MLSLSAFALAAVTLQSLTAVAQNTTYQSTFTWYGTGDQNGSPNCNSNTVACGFYTFPGYAAAVSQNLYGAASGQGVGPACGTCWRLTIEEDPIAGKATKNAGHSIVVIVNNLCPATDPNPLCLQPDLQTANEYGGMVDFNLCNDDMARAALFQDTGIGLATGTATQVDCSEWSGTKKTDCGSNPDCQSTPTNGQVGGAEPTTPGSTTAGQLGGSVPAEATGTTTSGQLGASGSGSNTGQSLGGSGRSVAFRMRALLLPLAVMLGL